MADLNGDAVVNLTDLAILLTNFGENCSEGFRGDGNFDPLAQWLRSADPQAVLEWWHAGQPPIEEDR